MTEARPLTEGRFLGSNHARGLDSGDPHQIRQNRAASPDLQQLRRETARNPRSPDAVQAFLGSSADSGRDGFAGGCCKFTHRLLRRTILDVERHRGVPRQKLSANKDCGGYRHLQLSVSIGCRYYAGSTPAREGPRTSRCNRSSARSRSPTERNAPKVSARYDAQLPSEPVAEASRAATSGSSSRPA